MKTPGQTSKPPLLLKRLLEATRGAWEVAAATVRGFRADRGIDLAASLAFATLLTAVPLLATFSRFLATLFQENVTEILDVVNAILPYHTARVTENLRDFIAESTAISGIGLAIFILASIRLIFIVEGVFNAVWGAPRRRARLSRVLMYGLVLLALALLLGALGLGLRVLKGSATGHAILTSPAAISVFPFAIEFGTLTLLYHYLPNALVRGSPAALAGGVVAAALELLRFLFHLYVRALSQMNLITGSLALVLFTLVSIYLAWVLILMGVELTCVLQGGGQRPAGRSAGLAEKAIRMLVRLAAGRAGRIEDLYTEQEASSVEAEQLLEQLRAGGLIEGDRTEGFILARPAHRITVADVVNAISPDLFTVAHEAEDRVALVLEPIFHRLHAARRSLLSATIADLWER
ncbi:MAG: YhjD/YihY/BrkB family envelope integrity protein [Thermoanaerobaculia bacterium]